MITVSIIIPCYNASKYLKNCLEKIYKDELENKEIILINDGSKDNTLKIMQEERKKHKEIIIINQKNSGQAVARNKGIAKARGKYISFLDVDDNIEINAFKIMYDYAEKNKNDYVYCDYYMHYLDKDIIVQNNYTKSERKNAILANFAPWGKLIKKELIEKENFSFLSGKIFEDIAVIPHIAAKSKHPSYLNKPLIYYNMTNESTTRKKEYDKRYEDMIYVSDYIYNLFRKDNLLKEYEEELKYIYLDSILKSGVLKFAKYKEGLKNIPVLRKNVNNKFQHLTKTIYFKKDKLYRKITAYIALYLPPYLIYLLKKMK